jgi:hypothetical protein
MDSPIFVAGLAWTTQKVMIFSFVWKLGALVGSPYVLYFLFSLLLHYRLAN